MIEKNLETINQAGKLYMDFWQSAANRQQAVFQESINRYNTYLQNLMQQDDLPGYLQQRVELIQEVFENTVANMSETLEMLSQSNREAADMMTKRISESLDEVKESIDRLPNPSVFNKK